MPSQHPCPDAVRAADPRTGLSPSPEVVALLAQVDRLRAAPGVAVRTRSGTAGEGIRTLPRLDGTPAGGGVEAAFDDDDAAAATAAPGARPGGEDGGDRAPAQTPLVASAPEVGSRLSWRRALALLALGCLALGIAFGCSVFAASFYVAALIEPRDVLMAAREALFGTVLLGAGASAGLAWALVAEVGYEAGAGTVMHRRRKATLYADDGALKGAVKPCYGRT